MQRLDDEQIERILAMVDASAAVVAPDERDDSFDDYADLMRTEHVLPGTESHAEDRSAAGIADALIPASPRPWPDNHGRAGTTAHRSGSAWAWRRPPSCRSRYGTGGRNTG